MKIQIFDDRFDWSDRERADVKFFCGNGKMDARAYVWQVLIYENCSLKKFKEFWFSSSLKFFSSSEVLLSYRSEFYRVWPGIGFSVIFEQKRNRLRVIRRCRVFNWSWIRAIKLVMLKKYRYINKSSEIRISIFWLLNSGGASKGALGASLKTKI